MLEGRLDRGAVLRDELGIDQYPDELVDTQLSVLVAQRVDGGGHDGRRPGELRRHVLRCREEGVVVVREVGREEVPGGARLRQILVDADVAAPDRADAARRAHAPARAERLRIVHDEHVAVGKPRQKLGRELGADPIVERAVGGSESRVSRAVEQVVQPLCEREELGFGRLDDRPARGDSELAEHRDLARHHLRHAAATRRRVDHPHCPARELGNERRGVRAQLRDAPVEVRHRGIVVERDRLDLDVVNHVGIHSLMRYPRSCRGSRPRSS